MLKAIKNFFELNMIADAPLIDPDHQLKLATASLLIEMMNQDGQILETEKIAVRHALKDNFNLEEKEIIDLCQLAEQEVRNSTDYYQFTCLITDHYSQKQKIQVIELLWRVAYADHHLDAYEEHMVRRIADLIHVPHQDFIRTKLKVQKSLS